MKMSDAKSEPRPHALVVDDEAIIRLHAMSILDEAGFDAYEAENTEAALQVLQQHSVIRLLFTDIRMPGLRDGLALARETASLFPNIRIILASGYAQPDTGQIPDGAIFISKPYDTDAVHACLKRLFPTTPSD